MGLKRCQRNFYNFRDSSYHSNTIQGKNLERLEATKLTGGFCTFNQARKMGAKVIKGSKAVARLTRLVQDAGKDSEFRSYPVFHQSQIQLKSEDK